MIPMPNVHPVANIFPMMTNEEIDDLAESIRLNGQVEPCVLLPDGRLFDGRNRWAACNKVGIAPLTKVWRRSEKALVDYVMALNLDRRHLTATQKAAVAVESLPFFEIAAKERQKRFLKKGPVGAKSIPTGKVARDRSFRAVTLVAKAAGAGVGSTQTLKVVKQRAPEVFELAKSGLVSVTDADTISEFPETQRVDVVGRINAGGNPKAILKEVVQQEEDTRESKARRKIREMCKSAQELADGAVKFRELLAEVNDLIESREEEENWIGVERRDVVIDCIKTIKGVMRAVDSEFVTEINAPAAVGALT